MPASERVAWAASIAPSVPGVRALAVKVVRPDYAEDDEFRRRFRKEIDAAQRVRGLYTAPVVDADSEGCVLWLATAYVPVHTG